MEFVRMKFARIENWILSNDRLSGNVTGHPEFKDGEFVHTSMVKVFMASIGYAITNNTIYILGKEINGDAEYPKNLLDALAYRGLR